MYAVEPSDVDLMKYREYMGPDPTQPPPPTSAGSGGLARYRSAPTSFFASLLEGGGGGFADLLSGGVPYDLQFPESVTAVKEEMAAEQHNQFTGFEDGVFKSSDEIGNNQVQVQLQGKINGLARQSSSPAGFFSSLAVDNGFSAMSDVGNYRAANGVRMKPFSSTRLNDHTNFSSVQSSTSRYMPQIDENVNESIDPDNGHFASDSTNDFYNPIYQNNNWNESSLSGLKRSREPEDKFSGFNAVDSQSGENRDYPNRLAHHMSLPKTSGEMAAIEKYLQFQQDAVPCKIRAKRGFATHPRSIAERVRRTRISDRMKKLQDLFPNMDKQTNTAEMLDLAVEYIKDLQNQVQTLTGKKAKCTCSK